MPVRDTFPYAARWDSVGLDCSQCRHFVGPPCWPDVAGLSRCTHHDLSLAVEHTPDGYERGEWFCRDFEASHPVEPQGLLARLLHRPATQVSAAALRHLDEVRGHLESEVLYGFYGDDGNLKEYAFAQLRGRARTPEPTRKDEP